ncbi:MAG: homocysteine S-methyltransferase family protein [Candidatus Omnitrophica bacterium]|nr:homocysteine S-methyltransferase family protein [Candidatus Omnitrophota bacterium]
MKLTSLLNTRIVILDGATGTELQKSGMPQGVAPEKWVLENPRILTRVACDYRDAGSDIVYTCTFGANRYKLAQYKISDVQKINTRIARITRRALGKNTLIAGDIGPTGKFIEPFGPVPFDEAVAAFKEQIKGLVAGGVDLLVIETMMDIQEARAALIAAREVTNMFTMVTMTYERDGRTLNGTDPVTALVTLQSLGAHAVGCNCSTGPGDMVRFIAQMKPYARVPLLAKPNAGMPRLQKGKTVFDMSPKEFSGYAGEFAKAGINLMGGCCGTSPEYIRELKKQLRNKKPQTPRRFFLSALSSSRTHVIIEKDSPLIIIGECINPTGKKSLQKELREKKTALLRQLASEQVRHGADMLDVNVGASGVDEAEMLKEAIKVLAVNTTVPLVIDSSDIRAIADALKLYPGRALVNSISGEKAKLKKMLPLIKKYGAMAIVLPLTDKGVPHTCLKRKKAVNEIYRKVKRAGLAKEDIVVDALALTVSSDRQAPGETLNTIRWCHDEFDAATVVGLSNISFGLPRRSQLNSAFLAMASSCGLTMAIANPLSEGLMHMRHSSDVLTGKDDKAVRFIRYVQEESGGTSSKSAALPASPQERVYTAILEGNRQEIEQYIGEALKGGIDAEKIMQEGMVTAINTVGELFDKKEYFLPQLIASAETMKQGFEFLKPHLKNTQGHREKRNVIMLATVKGDIHDIGKNIVALMLENHGFHVIDLGKDVSVEKIINEIKKHKSPLIGLSALMTTTMVNMQDVVDAVRKESLDCRFIVGGAVITKSFAHSLGAEYAADGVAAVRVAKSLSARKTE